MLKTKTPSSFCYWSVVDDDYALMAETMIWSARQSGVEEEFHVWSNRPVSGAVRHASGRFDKTHYLFKLRFLQEQVKRLPYDCFVWLDADNYFVRNPGNLLRLLENSPVHASLESDTCLPRNIRKEWQGCPLPVFAHLMRTQGVRHPALFNVNAGFWMVRRDAVDRFCELALAFWSAAAEKDYIFTEEPPIAYATHMLCPDPSARQLRRWSGVWASDWHGHFSGRLPDGQPWEFHDFLTLETIPVDPAIVHAITSKEAMVARARSLRRLRSNANGKAGRRTSGFPLPGIR